MNLKNGQITVGELASHTSSKEIILREFPILNERMIRSAWNMPLNQIVALAKSFGVPQNMISKALTELKNLEH